MLAVVLSALAAGMRRGVSDAALVAPRAHVNGLVDVGAPLAGEREGTARPRVELPPPSGASSPPAASPAAVASPLPAASPPAAHGNGPPKAAPTAERDHPPEARVHAPDDLGHGEYKGLVPPSPRPPPPPGASPPPSPPPLQICYDLEKRACVNVTGDPYTDARNRALASCLDQITDYWLPLSVAIAAVVLFLVHSIAVAPPGAAEGCLSPGVRTHLNVVATSMAYMLCAWAYLTFNALVLLSVDLPCLVSCAQMGAACVVILTLNGAVSAVCHSRTRKVVTATVHDVYSGCLACSADVAALCLPCCGDGGGGKGGGAKSAPADASDGGDVALSSAPSFCHPRHSCGLSVCGMRRWTGIKIGSANDVWR